METELQLGLFITEKNICVCISAPYNYETVYTLTASLLYSRLQRMTEVCTLRTIVKGAQKYITL